MITPRFFLPLLLGALLVPTLSGCDATTSAVEPEFVVQSYLVAGEPLPPVRVFRPTPMGQDYDSTAAAVRGAEVAILRLDADGGVQARYAYEAVHSGTYKPVGGNVVVQSGVTYRLEVQPPGDGSPISATTTVPDAFKIVEVRNQEAVYQGPVQPSVTITRSDVEGRQPVYVFTVTSLLDFEHTPEEELRAELTPFFADVFEPDGDDIEDMRVGSSPLFNEANYEVNDDGTITVKLPWIAVTFYGPSRVTISVLDDNLYDFLRTQNVQQGGLSPGAIPNIIEHVEGGTGIFGSYARQTVEVYVARPGESATPHARGGEQRRKKEPMGRAWILYNYPLFDTSASPRYASLSKLRKPA